MPQEHVADRQAQDLSVIMARAAAEIQYEDIPPECIEIAKKSVLDTIGVVIGATGTIPLVETFRRVVPVQQNGEATLFGFGGSTFAWAAAFVNGAASHALDYDDQYESKGMGHPSPPIVVAALALAEKLANVDGRTFLTGIAIGQELYVRLLDALQPIKAGFLGNQTIGVFPAAVACGKLLGFDTSKMSSALALAACKNGGVEQLVFSPTSEIRGIYNAFAPRDAVFAALLAAQQNFSVEGLFEGKHGFIPVYFKGQYDRDAVVSGLGREFRASQIGHKPWPSCRFTHSYIEAALQLKDTIPQDVRAIEKIVVHVGSPSDKLCEPLEVRQRPRTPLEAKFSIPFCVGLAFAKGAIGIRDFLPDGLRDPEVLPWAGKVSPKFDPAFGLSDQGLNPGMVEVRMAQGDVKRAKIDGPRGGAKRPLSREDLVRKFKDCVSFSAKPLAASRVERAIDMIWSLEKVSDVGQLALQFR